VTLERKFAAAMLTDDATWLRHANPWLSRDLVPVPARHRIVPHVLNSVTAVGAALIVWGLATLAVWPTLLGSALVFCGKLWFLDRMVWLYEDVIAENEHYRSWLE
jgi:hypothetical protein